jgi:putative SOS response-associated peptidase YedK
MCGRFTQHYTWEEVHAFLNVFGDLNTPRNLQPRYNIAPTTFIDVVTSRVRNIVGREMVPMRWGLIPDWWKKSRKDVPATFNARAETVAEKPMFRGAFKYRRCIIPASGFYEWTGDKDARQPHLFTAADGSPVLAFAGLWDRWIDPDNFDEVISATIIVSGASAWMRPYHDRMPVLLQPEDFDGWLHGTLGADLLKPASERALREWTVTRRINRAGEGDNDPSIVLPEAVAVL